MRARAKRILRDSLIVSSIAIALLGVIEVAFRVFWPQTLRTSYEGGVPMGQPDPVLGHRYTPGTTGYHTGPEFPVSERINEAGMRDEATYGAVPDSGVFRVLAIGDSFTMGAGSEYSDMWPVIAERRLIDEGLPVEIVKAGVGGYDTRTELLYLRELLPRFNPQLVLVGFLPNDLFTNEPVSSANRGAASDRPATRMAGKGGKYHTLEFLKHRLLSRDGSYVRIYARTARLDYFRDPKPAELRRKLEVTRDLLDQIEQATANHGAELAVHLHPAAVSGDRQGQGDRDRRRRRWRGRPRALELRGGSVSVDPNARHPGYGICSDR